MAEGSGLALRAEFWEEHVIGLSVAVDPEPLERAVLPGSDARLLHRDRDLSGDIVHAVEVGKAKVKKLYPRMCLADVVSASPDGKVEKNFVVKFSRAPRGGGT